MDKDCSNELQNLKVQIQDKVMTNHQIQTHWEKRAGKENVYMDFPDRKYKNTGHVFTISLRTV